MLCVGCVCEGDGIMIIGCVILVNKRMLFLTFFQKLYSAQRLPGGTPRFENGAGLL